MSYSLDKRAKKSKTEHDLTRHDTGRHDTTRDDTTRHDTTPHDTTRHDTTRHDTTRRKKKEERRKKKEERRKKKEKFALIQTLEPERPLLSRMQLHFPLRFTKPQLQLWPTDADSQSVLRRLGKKAQAQQPHSIIPPRWTRQQVIRAKRTRPCPG